MNIILSGSLGHISKPLTETLVQQGHTITVISSKAERQKEIEAIGAKAAIGTFGDVDFLTATFTGADAVYVMEATAPSSFFDQNIDLIATVTKIGSHYKQAIQQSGVKQVVHLSSIGAHMDKGNGILAFHHNVENLLKTLPSDVNITFMRPVGFYYNLLGFIQGIKSVGMMASNYGGDDMIPWVSPIDIAASIAEVIVKPFKGRDIIYVASEELTCNEVASILGNAIGKPDLRWIVIPNEQLQSRSVAIGMNPQVAAGLVEMNASMHTGKLFEDYYLNRPTLGKVKLKDFAKEFAATYNA